MRTTNKSGQSSNFGQMGPRDAELQPLINVRNWFLLNILRMDGQNLTKFCIHIIMGPRDAELQPLINVRNWFLLNILRMDGQNLTKFCIHIIIDNISVTTVRRHFSQICNGYSP